MTDNPVFDSSVNLAKKKRCVILNTQSNPKNSLYMFNILLRYTHKVVYLNLTRLIDSECEEKNRFYRFSRGTKGIENLLRNI